ncbi:tumor necrosis factor receptor superfamily member 10A-like [Tenrec ecaudatus]|uniref:tumor necrosis factor receptor superfamily member 10A-like n=1 Tax=Tenrec ecaudatus TaxID=94439 RepID=UPI003F5958D0
MAGRGCSLVARRRSASKRISRKENPGEDRGGGKSAEDLGPRGAAGHCPRARRLAGRVPDSSGAHRTGPKVLKNMFLFVVLSLLVPVELAPINLPDRVHSQAAAPQQQSLKGKCDPGFHLSASTGKCDPCKPGVEYTNVTNSFSSCFLCHSCDFDQVERTPCTATRDRECVCKPGGSRDENDTEMCGSHIPRKTGTKTTEKARAYEEPVPTGLGTPTTATPPPSSIEPWKIWMIVLGVIGLLLALGCWSATQGVGVISKVMNRWQCPSRWPESGDNAHNEALNSKQNPELETEDKEQAEVAGALDEIPMEAESLLEPAHAQGSQMGRMLLVPASDADPTETLRSSFDDIITHVPIDSWNRIMRKLGLTDNEIQMARKSAHYSGEEPHQLLSKWLHKLGKKASINTLLDVLETLGERHARETVQDHLVGSGVYTWEPYMCQ